MPYSYAQSFLNLRVIDFIKTLILLLLELIPYLIIWIFPIFIFYIILKFLLNNESKINKLVNSFIIKYEPPVDILINYLENKDTKLSFTFTSIQNLKSQIEFLYLQDLKTSKEKLIELKRIKARVINFKKSDKQPYEYSLNVLYITTIFGTTIGLLDILVNYFKNKSNDLVTAILSSVVILFSGVLFFFFLTMRLSIVPRIQKEKNQDVAILAIDEMIDEIQSN